MAKILYRVLLQATSLIHRLGKFLWPRRLIQKRPMHLTRPLSMIFIRISRLCFVRYIGPASLSRPSITTLPSPRSRRKLSVPDLYYLSRERTISVSIVWPSNCSRRCTTIIPPTLFYLWRDHLFIACVLYIYLYSVFGGPSSTSLVPVVPRRNVPHGLALRTSKSWRGPKDLRAISSWGLG